MKSLSKYFIKSYTIYEKVFLWFLFNYPNSYYYIIVFFKKKSLKEREARAVKKEEERETKEDDTKVKYP